MTDDVFSSEKSVTEPTAATQGDQDNPLETLVGEGKKYQSVEELAKSRVEADQFIERLKQENAQMREDLGTFQSKVEEYEGILKAHQGEPEKPTQPSEEQVEPEKIAALVDERLQEHERQRGAEHNLKSAQDELVQQFEGNLDEARKFLQKRATDLGVSVDYLKEQAANSPTVFRELVGKREQAPAQPSSAASLPSKSAPPTSGVKEGTWAYYEELRKTNPKKYWSPAVQNRMHQDAREKGSDFYK